MWDPYERYFFPNKLVYYNERNKEKENRDYYERFDEEYRRQLSFRESNNEREKLWRNNFQQMPLYSPDESFLDEFNSKFKRKCSLDEEIERRNDEFQNRRDIESSFRRNSSRNVGLDHFDIDSLSVHRRESIEKRSYFDYNEFLNTDEKPVSDSLWGVINKTHLDEEFEEDEEPNEEEEELK